MLVAAPRTAIGAVVATIPTPVHRDHALRHLPLVALVVALVLVVVLLNRDWGSDSTTSTHLQGSGIAATQSRDLAPFERIELAGANTVTVHVGSAQAVVVRADDNLIDHVTTEVRDGTLVVANRENFTTQRPMSVTVTVPSVDSVRLSGSGIVDVQGVQAQQLTVRVPGTGTVTVSGTVDRLDASLGGSGDVRLGDLVARDVKATVSGTGRLEVRATASLDASVTGVGTIVYRGSPATVTRHISGTGSITDE
jgi:hypothetical protein